MISNKNVINKYLTNINYGLTWFILGINLRKFIKKETNVNGKLKQTFKETRNINYF